MRKERGLRKGAIVSLSPQGMTSWSSSIKIWFLQAYRMHYLKKNVMNDQKRRKGWWRGRRERNEKGSRERIEIERKETMS